MSKLFRSAWLEIALAAWLILYARIAGRELTEGDALVVFWPFYLTASVLLVSAFILGHRKC